MALNLETIRTLTIRGQSIGMDALVREIKEFGVAHSAAAAAAAAAAGVTDTAARKQLSAAAAYDRVAQSIDPAYRAQKRFEQGALALTRALEQGIGADRYGANLEALAKKYDFTSAAQRQMIAEARELRAALDPLAASQERLGEATRRYSELRSAGLLTAQQEAAAIAVATQRHHELARAQSQSSRFGGLEPHRLGNLGYQASDVFAQAASGTPPAMIAMMQGPQIFDALSGGAGFGQNVRDLGAGIAGVASQAIRAIGPGGLVLGGLSAATAAAIYFGDETEANFKKIEKAAESYAATLQELQRGQRGLAQGITDVADRELRRTPGQAQSLSAAEIQEQQRAIKAARENALSFDPTETGTFKQHLTDWQNIGRMVAGKTSSSDITVLGRQLYEGSRAAKEIRTELENIKADPSLPKYLSDGVNEMLKFTNQVIEGQAALAGLTTGAAEFRRTMALSDTAAAGDAFQQYVPSTRTDREEVQRAYNRRIAAIGQFEGADRGLAERMRVAAVNDLRKALNDLDRQEQNARGLRALDLRAITDRAAAERALTAEQRVRLDLEGQNIEASEKSARIAAASAQIFAQANREAQDALRASQQANSVAGIEGYQAALAGIVYRYQEQIEAADGAAEAVSNLTRARDLDIHALQIQTQKGLFDRQRDHLRGLQAEAEAIGATDDQRRRLLVNLQVEADIRRAGINAMGAQAEAYRENARALSDYEERVRRSGEAWNDMRQSGESAIDGLTEALTSGDWAGALKSASDDFAKTMLELTIANPAKNGLLGTNHSTIFDLFNGPGAAPDLNVPAVQAVQTMQVTAAVVNLAPTGPAGALGAINNGLLGGAANDNRLSNLTPGSVQEHIANFFAGKGMKPHQIAGIMGNVHAESGFNPLAVGDAGEAFGLFQHNDRKGALFNAIGGRGNLGDVQAQLEFVWRELLTTEAASMQRLIASKDVRGATEAFVGFERPRGYSVANPAGAHNFSGRLSAAEDAYASLGTTASGLATSAATFQTNFDQTMNQHLIGGMGQVVNMALPGFGGVFQTLVSGLSQAAGGGGGGISLGTVAAILGGAPGLFAEGTRFAPGGMAIVGERGPEIVNLPRGSQVIPNHDLARLYVPANQPSGSTNVYAPVFNAPGADAAGLARLERAVEAQGRQFEQMNRSFEGRVDSRNHTREVRRTRAGSSR